MFGAKLTHFLFLSFSLILTLPQPKRAVGYARWAVQKLNCQILRIPFYWSVDDNVAVVRRLILSSSSNSSSSSGSSSSGSSTTTTTTTTSSSRKTYESVDVVARTPGFLEAFMSIQAIPSLEKYGLIGLLRDRGTAKLCTFDYKSNVVSIYKMLLINSAGLEREGIEYNQWLKKWEDVSLNSRILEKENLRTLKISTFAYWAFNKAGGGCFKERSGDSRVVRNVSDIVEKDCESLMKPWEVQDAQRMVNWARPLPGRVRTANGGEEGEGEEEVIEGGGKSNYHMDHFEVDDMHEAQEGPEPHFLQAENILAAEADGGGGGGGGENVAM